MFTVCGVTAATAWVAQAGSYPGCPGTGQQSSGPDVIIGTLCHDANTNYAFSTVSGVDYEAFSMGTTSCNIGTTHLQWLDSTSSDNRHPVIGQNFFRLKLVDGSRRFEQLAQAWLKHGFCALCGTACCTDRTDESCDFLGVGCSDPYSSSRNGSQTQFIGPKWEVNATTGVHPEPRSNPPGATSSNVSRRMHIRISELEVSNGSGDVNATRYFGEGQYVASDDSTPNPGNPAQSNKNNNCSYRPISVSGSGTAWTFTAIGSTTRQQPAIRAWKATDPTASIPGVITQVLETNIVTPEDAGRSALLILAAQATKLQNGLWHYEYALYNMNSDRSVASFSLPVSDYASITNIGFRDVSYWDGDGPGNVTINGNDWPGLVSHGEIAWNMDASFGANSNALRWGTMYNFRFDCDVDPIENGTVTMNQFKTGAQTLNAVSITPGSVTCLRGDINGDGNIDGLDVRRFTQVLVSGGATAREKCAGDLEASPDFVIDVDDVDNFANCLLAGGGC